ncbi:MAG: ribosomal protein small subunit ribosomal protein [Candidatus Parcubacteria bacterium]|jgi:small subunit ribosomal protein S11
MPSKTPQSKKKVDAPTDAVSTEVSVAASVQQRKSKKLENGRVYINASYNNTVISFTDTKGNLIAWGSAGSLGFSGPKKATPFASSKVVAALAEKVKPLGLTNVDVFVKGIGGGRDAALRSIINQGFVVTSIKDVTPVPHNGPRPKKVRRV